MTPRVTFVIPVRNDARRLAICLEAIGRNLTAAGDAEIIVIDNGSTDDSPVVARAMGATVLSAPVGRVAALRNLGAEQARADILAFIDADNEIGPGWMAALFDVLQDPAIAAAGALYLAPPDGTWVQRAYGSLRGRTSARESVEWLGAGNLAIRRSAFAAVHGFDTTLEACEDVDLCARVRATGAALVADPRLISVHHGDPATLRALFKSELWRGRDNLKVTFRQLRSWTELPSALIPVIDGLMLAAALIGTGAAIAGAGWGLPLIAAALLVIAAGAIPKAVRASMRARLTSARSFLQDCLVACVYDLARALALVMRAPHRNVRADQAAAS